MKKILILLVIIVVVIIAVIYFKDEKSQNTEPIPKEEMLDLTLFLQDKEIARVSDCGQTYQVIQQIPKTNDLLDASLKILFQDELAKYGQYDSVRNIDGVAQVMLKSSMTSNGYPISSLSSCESQHILSVLNDTLRQYPEVSSVELFSPEGKIEF